MTAAVGALPGSAPRPRASGAPSSGSRQFADLLSALATARGTAAPGRATTGAGPTEPPTGPALDRPVDREDGAGDPATAALTPSPALAALLARAAGADALPATVPTSGASTDAAAPTLTAPLPTGLPAAAAGSVPGGAVAGQASGSSAPEPPVTGELPSSAPAAPAAAPTPWSLAAHAAGAAHGNPLTDTPLTDTPATTVATTVLAAPATGAATAPSSTAATGAPTPDATAPAPAPDDAVPTTAPDPSVPGAAAAPTTDAGTDASSLPAGSTGAEVPSAEPALVGTQGLEQTLAPTTAAEVRSAVATTAAPATPSAPAPPPHTQVVQLLGPVLEGPDGAYSLSLQLYPEELGAVEVEVLLRGGELRLALHAVDESAQSALRAAVPDLRADLQSSGLTATSVSVDGGRSEQPPSDRSTRSPAPHQPSHLRSGDVGSPAPSVHPATSSSDVALDLRM